MTWTYVQKTGALSRNGNPIGTGYSGNTIGLDKPEMQDKGRPESFIAGAAGEGGSTGATRETR